MKHDARRACGVDGSSLGALSIPHVHRAPCPIGPTPFPPGVSGWWWWSKGDETENPEQKQKMQQQQQQQHTHSSALFACPHGRDPPQLTAARDLAASCGPAQGRVARMHGSQSQADDFPSPIMPENWVGAQPLHHPPVPALPFRDGPCGGMTGTRCYLLCSPPRWDPGLAHTYIYFYRLVSCLRSHSRSHLINPVSSSVQTQSTSVHCC